MYTVIRILRFEPPPVGHSKDEDFDPVVHLEICDEVDENAAEEEAGGNLMDDDDEGMYVDREKVKNIHKAWLSIQPQKIDFASLLNECF